MLCLFMASQMFAQQSQSFVEHWFGINPQDFVQQNAQKSTKPLPSRVHATGLRSTPNSSGIITLDLSQPTNPASFTLDANRVWVGGTSPIVFNNGVFSLSHFSGGWWHGFTFSKNAENINQGAPGNSGTWIGNDGGNMATGGIKTDAEGSVMRDENGVVMTDSDIPYLVAYWASFFGETSLRITLDAVYEAVGVYINTSPWPYWGNISGDGFARPLNQEGDYFRLIIHGLNENLQNNGQTVVHYLAKFENGVLTQSRNWEWVDLSALGEIGGVFFTMESTDSGQWGINTAAYFCIDRFQVRVPTEAPEAPTNLTGIATETTVHLSWTASVGNVAGYNIYVVGVLFETISRRTDYIVGGLTASTMYQFDVEAIDNDGNKSEKASISVSTTEPVILDVVPPTITTTSLFDGTVGASYSETLTATGDNQIFVWALYSGHLPNGLDLYVDGTIAGTPSEDGEFEFEVIIINGAGADKKTLSIRIDAATSTNVNLNQMPQNSLQAWIQNDKLHVSGLTAGQRWNVYNVSGQLVYHNIANSDTAEIMLPVRGTHIVQSRNRSVKIVF